MKHTAFFGDGEKTFALPAEQILELERKTGTGVGTIYSRVMTGQFQFADIMEVIRLGLIGGGTSPKEAQALVDAYARPTSIIEAFQLAAIAAVEQPVIGKAGRFQDHRMESRMKNWCYRHQAASSAVMRASRLSSPTA